jgi:hypothetical protein
VEAYRVYLNLLWLAGEVGSGAGDVAGGADYAPTETSRQVLAQIEKELEAARVAFEALMRDEIPAFNKLMAGQLAPIVF